MDDVPSVRTTNYSRIEREGGIINVVGPRVRSDRTVDNPIITFIESGEAGGPPDRPS